MIRKLHFLSLVVLVFGVVGNASGELLVHYGFDETSGNTVVDSTGGNDGTIFGGSWATPGAQAQTSPGHIVLSGDEARVEVPGLPSSAGDFTIVSWLKKTNMVRFPWFVGTEVGGENLQIVFEEEEIEGFVGVGCGGEWNGGSGTTSFRSHEWRHIAFVRHVATGAVELYIDGVKEDTFTCGFGLVDMSTFMIGNWPRAWSDQPGRFRPLNGGYDDFAIWDEALLPGALDGSEAGTINYYRLNGVLLRENIQFDLPESGAFEGVSTASLGVTLHNAKAGLTYTVQYAVSGGSATAGADYNLQPGTLTFAPGETTKTINIDIISDGVAEPDETIIVTLSNPSGGALEIGAKSQHTYTIYNGPPPAFFASDGGYGQETDASGEVEIVLGYPTNQTVTVDYAPSGGTATAGADYVLPAGTVTFAPGDVSETISVTILDDGVNEGSEKVLIGLSNPSNATIGTPSEHAYRIYDDEAGIPFDGMVWYHSEWPNLLDLTDDSELQWAPRKYHQVIVRLPEQRLSQVGDVAEFTYLWKSEGDVIGCDCDHQNTSGCFDIDITCLSGTSGDFRLGLFDSNGRGFVDDEYMGNSADVFNGYLGYGWFIYPHVDTDLPDRIVDYRDEVHKPGFTRKRTSPYAGEGLLKTGSHWGDLKAINGFGLTPGEFSPLILRLERTSASSVQVSITLNDVTYTAQDNDGADQPQKIDAFAMYFHHSTRPFSYATLAIPATPRSSNPGPADGAKDVSLETLLTWRPGTVADSYDVYLGTDFDGVNNATTASRQYKGNQGNGSYYPGGLEFATVYYWRVDDVTASETLKGQVWSFTTQRCLEAFEDFESYADTSSLLSEWSEGGGGYVELSTTERRRGLKSLRLEYYNKFGLTYSECGHTFGDAQDWASSVATALGFYFKGSSGNQGDEMYVILEDTGGNSATVMCEGSPGDLLNETWQARGVNLDEFTGVDLGAVKKVFIGVGDRDGTSSGAAGWVYFDDIRLCRGTCEPGSGPAQDLSGDCLVNFKDHAIKASGWVSDSPHWQDYADFAESWLEEKLVWP